jgi:F0F1-type ATP synthase delta subunit
MKLSRRQVASYLTAGLPSDRSRRIQQVAAWLVANRHSRDAAYVTRDVASELATNGYLSATIWSAHPASPELLAATTATITRLTGAQKVELTSNVDPDHIGGIVIELPGGVYDGSVRRQLNHLTAEMAS